MSTSSRRLIAWIALAAMLFGAVSPALAAALFQDRPDILGRMLAIPAPPAATVQVALQEAAAAADDDLCPHESAGRAPPGQPSHSAHHGSSSHESPDESEHAAHGTFCSFCLSSGSTVTLPAPAVAIWAAPATIAVLRPVAHDQRPSSLHTATRHPRDPPVILT